ncbi:MAG: homoserine O-acetyltransferase [Bacteroidota bacterium]
MKTFFYTRLFDLENKSQLPGLEIAYHTYGKLNKQGDNVVWVCHALTANSDVNEWWPGLFGEHEYFNPEDHFIVCANNLGSCYGTTGPLSVNKYTNQPWYSYFPQITIRDMVNAHELLRRYLGIQKINVLIGGSQGGQQVLEWAIKAPGLIENCIVIASNAKHSPWGVAFNESQRLAIKADRTYYGNEPEGGKKGLSAARSIALLSYRNYHTYSAVQKEYNDEKISDFNAASYQRHQGEKLSKRFNAYSYVALLSAMDTHNVGRGRRSAEEALGRITANTLIIGLSSDILFPPIEQLFLAKHIQNSSFRFIDSLYGHDGFLLETKKITKLLSEFMPSTKYKTSGTSTDASVAIKQQTTVQL